MEARPDAGAVYPMTGPKKQKRWRSINGQLARLKDQGMVITDDEQARAALRRLGYCRLSGYWSPFYASDAQGKLIDAFVPGTKLAEIVELYIFDKRLRLLALDALERIELALQTDVAHTLGKLDPMAHTKKQYLDQKYVKNDDFKKRSDFKKWSDKYKSQKERFRSQDFVKHNLDTYGELPLWVAVEIFDFGMLSRLFGMMRRPERGRIAARYGLSGGDVLEQWLKSLTYVRNVSAHHGRLWKNNIKDSAEVPGQFSELSQTNQYRAFRYFCIMQFFLQQICPQSTWKDRVREHLKNFPTPDNRRVTLDDLGIVEGWENWQLWRPENED